MIGSLSQMHVTEAAFRCLLSVLKIYSIIDMTWTIDLQNWRWICSQSHIAMVVLSLFLCHTHSLFFLIFAFFFLHILPFILPLLSLYIHIMYMYAFIIQEYFVFCKKTNVTKFTNVLRFAFCPLVCVSLHTLAG